MRNNYETMEKILLNYIYIQMNWKDVLSKTAVETTRVPNFKVILWYYATRFDNSTRPFDNLLGPTCWKNTISKLYFAGWAGPFWRGAGASTSMYQIKATALHSQPLVFGKSCCSLMDEGLQQYNWTCWNMAVSQFSLVDCYSVLVHVVDVTQIWYLPSTFLSLNITCIWSK